MNHLMSFLSLAQDLCLMGEVRYPDHVKLYEEDKRTALKDSKKIMNVIQPKLQVVLKRIDELQE